jgi:hypothetical protein
MERIMRIICLLAGIFVGAAATAAPSWVWSARGNRPSSEKIDFRKTVTVAPGHKSAKLVMSCDNAAEAFVNGKSVLKTDSWATPRSADISKHLKAGKNVILIKA